MRLALIVVALSCVSVGAAAGQVDRLPGRIAYSSRNGDLWVMLADGTHRRRVTHSGAGTDFDPDFSPDGKRLVFRTSRGRYGRDRYGIGLEGIFVVSIRSRRERQIQPPHGGMFPAWSPDGRTIAFSGLRQDGAPVDTIQFMRPDGSGLTDTGAPGECATWSPDGSKLAYCSHSGDGNWAVWTMNADGSDRRQLTHPRLIPPAGAHGDYPAAWSPDGKRILYQADSGGDREVFVMNADGTGQRRVTRWRGADSPDAWLRDGRIVVGHFAGAAARPRWFVMRPDGTGRRRIPQLDGIGDPIDWLG
jgi:TolB protein